MRVKNSIVGVAKPLSGHFSNALSQRISATEADDAGGWVIFVGELLRRERV